MLIAERNTHTVTRYVTWVFIMLVGSTAAVAQDEPLSKHVFDSYIEFIASRQKSLNSESVRSEYDDSIETTIDLSWTFYWSENYTFTTALSHESFSYNPAEESSWESDWYSELSELFVSYSPDFLLNHELRLGRQSIFEQAQWWDTTVDAITLLGEYDLTSYIISAGTSNTDITSEKDLRDPASDNVY
jgi:hypothetical protein